VFIKDIAHYLFPPEGREASIAPSLRNVSDGTTSDGASPRDPPVRNPTVIPLELLRKFHFTFLIRHPRRAIPSYYRCTIPPLSAKTGFHSFMPSEAGYNELRRLFDYLMAEGLIGGSNGGVKITVVDADDLLDKPAEVIRAFCEDVGIDYHDGMLEWGDEEGQKMAVDAFEKWNGFHDDAISSTALRPRTHAKVSSISLPFSSVHVTDVRQKIPTEEEEDEEWLQKYGEEGQRAIRASVNECLDDYLYLKSFAKVLDSKSMHSA
jgi:hypothetical protein